MTTFWIDPTLSLNEQHELYIAWSQRFVDEEQAIWAMMWSDSESDDEEADENEELGDENEELGDEEWEDGPQTPPLGPRPLPRPPLVSIGGGLAVSDDDASSVSTGILD
jgi:hypothetical protein